MKKTKTYDEFKKAMRAADIKVSTSTYSDFKGVRLKTAQGCQLNSKVITQDFYKRHETEIQFINVYRENFEVFDGAMRVVF
jgi:ketopantoate reductase